MTKTIENLFQFLHLSADILTILLFLIFIKKSRTEKALILVAIYSFLDLGLNYFNPTFSRVVYVYIWSTFTFVEYAIFTFILASNLKNKRIRKLILLISIFFVLITTIFNITTNFSRIDSIPIGIETILILLYSFYYLYEQMNDTNNLFIYSKFQFWIVIGFMIYLAGSFFVFLFASRAEDEIINQYWFLTNGFYVLMNLLFCVAFILQGKKSKKTYSQQFTPYLN